MGVLAKLPKRLSFRYDMPPLRCAQTYTRKQGIEHRELALPADAPAWVADRAALWNAAKLAERRKDAKVAREYKVALPAELSPEQRRALTIGFAREISDRHGVAVDVAIHAPGREGERPRACRC